MAVISMSKNFSAGWKTLAHKLSWSKSAWMGVSWESNNRILSTACASILTPWIGAIEDFTIYAVKRWHSSASRNNKISSLSMDAKCHIFQMQKCVCHDEMSLQKQLTGLWSMSYLFAVTGVNEIANQFDNIFTLCRRILCKWTVLSKLI